MNDEKARAWREMLRKQQKQDGARVRRAQAHAPPSMLHPPGSGWNHAIIDYEAFAKADLCELWRIGWDNETSFARCQDLPSWYNIDGLWWRKA